MENHQSGEIIHLEDEKGSIIPGRPLGNKGQSPSIMRSLTRLVVGSILTGAGGIANRLQAWEDKVASSHESDSSPQSTQIPSEASADPAPFVKGDINTSIVPVSVPPRQVSSTDLMRYAVLGLIFETQDRIGMGMRTAGRFVRMVEHLTTPFTRPIQDSRFLSPARKQFGRLVVRGEQEVQKWIEVGRKEDIHSRDLADVALYDTVDFWIDYFAESPEVVDLVTSQSISFAEEVVEEVRERTVSADNFLEGVVRTVFRRPSRAELPPPPMEVRREALHTRKQVRRP